MSYVIQLVITTGEVIPFTDTECIWETAETVRGDMPVITDQVLQSAWYFPVSQKSTVVEGMLHFAVGT